MVVIQINDVGSVLYMFLCLFEMFLLDTEHEYAWHIDNIKKNFWKMWHIHDFILERVYQAFDGLATIHELSCIVTHE